MKTKNDYISLARYLSGKNMSKNFYKVTHYGFGEPHVFPRVPAASPKAAMKKTVGEIGRRLSHDGFTTKFGASTVSVEVRRLSK